MNPEALDRAMKLIEAITDDKTPRGLRVRMNEWFRSEASMDEKMQVMEDYMHRVLVPASKPDRMTRKMFRMFMRKYGIAMPAPVVRWQRVAMRAAAVLLPAVLVVGGYYLTDRFMTGPGAASPTVITASVDGGEEITLPDGSSVRMKGGTTLEYNGADFAENRRLEMDGEAFFTVAHDARHPFTVEGGDVAVTVLGTEFNMRAFDAEPHAEVVLATGSVEVSSGESSVVLKPSQKATIDRMGRTIELQDISGGELSRVRGMELVLDDVSLQEALRRTGEYFGVTMNVVADLPAAEGMIVKLEEEPTLDEALFMIQVINPVFDYRIDGDTVTITKRK